MEPIITIDNFDAGILADGTTPATNGGQMFRNVDIHRDDSILQLSQALAQETDVFTDLPLWIVRDDNEAVSKYWALGSSGKLYKTNSPGGTWTVHASVGGSGQGLHVYNGRRYYCTDDQLVASDGVTNEIDSDNLWHPMVTYIGKLMGGAGRYIFTLESDGTFTKRALPLPAGHRVKSLRVYGDRLVIGTWKGESITDEADSTLFKWDGVSDFPDEPFYLQEHGMNALVTWENILMDFAGIAGNLYVFNNAFLDKAKQIPNVDAEGGDYVYVHPGAVSQFQGNVLAGVSVGSGSAFAGVYTFGRKTEDLPFAMSLSHLISTGSTDSDVEIGAVLTVGTNRFLVGWRDDTSYGMDLVDTSARYSSGYIDTQKYEVAEGSEIKKIKGVAVTAKPLGSTTLTVSYDADETGSFTSAGTITSSNQNEVLYFNNVRAKVIQIRVTLNGSSNTSPKIKRIEIY